MKISLLGFLATGLLPLGGAPKEDPTTLYFFFSPETPGAGDVARRAVTFIKEKQGRAVLRPVLLIEDFKVLAQLGEESLITKAVREMGGDAGVDIPLYDEEGLRLAEAWHINRLPALVLVQGGHAHAVFGTRVDPKELEECK